MYPHGTESLVKWSSDGGKTDWDRSVSLSPLIWFKVQMMLEHKLIRLNKQSSVTDWELFVSGQTHASGLRVISFLTVSQLCGRLHRPKEEMCLYASELTALFLSRGKQWLTFHLTFVIDMICIVNWIWRYGEFIVRKKKTLFRWCYFWSVCFSWLQVLCLLCASQLTWKLCVCVCHWRFPVLSKRWFILSVLAKQPVRFLTSGFC